MLRGIALYVRRHHIALLALFFALGGTAVAASNSLLPKNSVGSLQVRNGSLAKIDLSKKAVKALKGNRGARGIRGAAGPQGSQGLQGATGPIGPKGDTGAPGTARAYATVGLSGTLDAAHSKNIASVNKASAGIYCITPAAGIDPATSSPVATLDANPGFVSNAEIYVETSPVSCLATQVEVLTRQQSITAGPALSSSNTDAGFTVVIP